MSQRYSKTQRDSVRAHSRPSYGKKLTAEFILMKSKQPITQVQKLNLWGQDLCDVSVLKDAPNMEVLALTVNLIDTLEDFQSMSNLKELYLRRNQIPADLQQLRYLTCLKNLRVLNLAENPISAKLGGIPCYRQVILKHLPWLEKLDDVPVNYEEVSSAERLDLENVDSMISHKTILEKQEYSSDSQFTQTPVSKKSRTHRTKQSNLKKQPEKLVKPQAINTGRNSFATAAQKKNSTVSNCFKPNNRNLLRTPPRSKYQSGVESGDSNSLCKEQSYSTEVTINERQDVGIKWLGGRNGLAQKQQKPISSWRQTQMEIAKQKPLQSARNSKRDHSMGMHAVNQQFLHAPMTPQYSPNNTFQAQPVKSKKPKRHEEVLKQPKQVKKNKSTKKQKRNENILCAIVALMSELDKTGLEFIKKDAKKKIAKISAAEQEKMVPKKPTKQMTRHWSANPGIGGQYQSKRVQRASWFKKEETTDMDDSSENGSSDDHSQESDSSLERCSPSTEMY